MKISGEAVLHAPVQRVWDALQDPAILVRTIPGCERLETTGPDAYAMTVTAGVAAIKGTYAGRVELSRQEPPNAFLMTASGSGGPGTVSTEVRVGLAADGPDTTRVSYDADAVVGGVVAGVGQRVLVAVAKRTAGEFFAAVDDVLTGRAVGPTVTAVAGADSPGTYVAPAAPAGSNDFVRGVLAGAAVALAGVAVGLLAGRRQRPAAPERSGRRRR